MLSAFTHPVLIIRIIIIISMAFATIAIGSTLYSAASKIQSGASAKITNLQAQIDNL